MSEDFVPVPGSAKEDSGCSAADYAQLYRESLENGEQFWLKQAKRIDWIKPPTVAGNWRFAPDVDIKWFEDGQLNACWKLRRPPCHRHSRKDRARL